MKRQFCIVMLILIPFVSGATDTIFDVRHFGAVGDGITKDTQSIQQAIDQCAENGGTVYLPGGTYLSGTLFLRDNVTLELAAGATLLGSTDIIDYPRQRPKFKSYKDLFHDQGLIYGEGLKNISIVGEGTIDGQGAAFKVTTKKKPDRYRNRPFVIWLISCKNVRVEGLRLQNSAMWMQQYLDCEDVYIHKLNVYNHCNKNNDMIDIDGSRNVVISDCIGDTDDDAITIKSSSNRPSENVTVTNCVVSSHCNAIKCGTESIGGFRNITISNCVVKPSAHPTKIYGTEDGISGITLAIVDGGIMDGVLINNIRIDGPLIPIYMRLGDRGRVIREGMPKPPVGVFKNVTLSNIIATNADTFGCSITGLPDKYVRNISLQNIRIQFKGGENRLPENYQVPELREHYPESTMFGKLPAYGFFIRHAEHIFMRDIFLEFKQVDERPVIVCKNVTDLDIFNLQATTTAKTPAYMVFEDVLRARVVDNKPLGPTQTFMQLRGNNNNLHLDHNDLSQVIDQSENSP